MTDIKPGKESSSQGDIKPLKLDGLMTEYGESINIDEVGKYGKFVKFKNWDSINIDGEDYITTASCEHSFYSFYSPELLTKEKYDPEQGLQTLRSMLKRLEDKIEKEILINLKKEKDKEREYLKGKYNYGRLKRAHEKAETSFWENSLKESMQQNEAASSSSSESSEHTPPCPPESSPV